MDISFFYLIEFIFSKSSSYSKGSFNTLEDLKWDNCPIFNLQGCKYHGDRQR